MKKIFATMLGAIILALPHEMNAQDIWVKRFEVNNTSIIARTDQVYDKSGEACAVLRCYVRGNDYNIDKTEVLKDSLLDGEIRLWVPKGTKKLTIRHKNLKPLIGYKIPIRVEKLTDYNVDIESIIDTNVGIQNGNDGGNTGDKGDKPRPKNHPFYLGAGYNIMTISGPSVSLGVNVKHHNIELGAVYGLNKTDELYFYDSNGDVIGGYNYNAISASLSYGYEIKASDIFAITPMIGSAYQLFMGKGVKGIRKNSDYERANSLSVTGGLRFTVAVSSRFKLCVTPEYHANVYKDKACKLVSKYDDKLKSWHTGFHLNVGFMFFL